MAVTTKLARYRYIAPLGSGGMATVALAEDTLLGRLVALKRMAAAADARGLLRLRREALLGASVTHPNLVSIYDVVTAEDGDVVIVMEYVRGETLRDALTRQGQLPAAEALRILEGVAAGLDAIHRRAIVHRDVKPANILLGVDGTVKVADLGIASVPDRTRITTTGGVLGSFSYMAPEQLENARSTPAIDVYALAAVAFEVLSGRKARREPNPVALAHAISTQPPPDLRDAWPRAPGAAAELLTRGMSRDPAERPHSAGELIGRLRAALEPETTKSIAPIAPPLPTKAASPVPRRSRRSAAAPAVLALVAAAVVLAVLLNLGGSQSRVQTREPARHRSRTASIASHPTTKPAGTAAGLSGDATRTPASSAGSSTSAPSLPASPPTAGSPVSSVESFYALAASHRYAEAWGLADLTFRSQLGGYQSFEAGQQADRSISFDAAQIVSQSASSATIAVRTTSVRTGGTQNCAGTVDLRRDGSSGRWLLHLIHINCT